MTEREQLDKESEGIAAINAIAELADYLDLPLSQTVTVAGALEAIKSRLDSALGVSSQLRDDWKFCPGCGDPWEPAEAACGLRDCPHASPAASSLARADSDQLRSWAVDLDELNRLYNGGLTTAARISGEMVNAANAATPAATAMPDSPTPRTDANLRGWDIPGPFAEFTRQLERELAEKVANEQAYERIIGPKSYQEVADEIAQLKRELTEEKAQHEACRLLAQGWKEDADRALAPFATPINESVSLAGDAAAFPGSTPGALSQFVTVPRELLSDLLAYGRISTVENVTYGAGRAHAERIREAEEALWASAATPPTTANSEMEAAFSKWADSVTQEEYAHAFNAFKAGVIWTRLLTSSTTEKQISVREPDNAGDSDRWQDPRDISGGEADSQSETQEPQQ